VRFIYNGNVLMGTTTDVGAPLYMYRNTNGGNIIRLENPNAGAGATMYFLATDGTHNSYFGQEGVGTGSNRVNQAFIYNDTAGVGLYAVGASGTIKLYSGGENLRVTIDASGNAGFGTSPNSPLHVA